METHGFKIKAPTPESRDQKLMLWLSLVYLLFDQEKNPFGQQRNFLCILQMIRWLLSNTCAQVLLFGSLSYLYLFILSNRGIWEYRNINLVFPDKHFMKNNIWNVILSDRECRMNIHMSLSGVSSVLHSKIISHSFCVLCRLFF